MSRNFDLSPKRDYVRGFGNWEIVCIYIIIVISIAMIVIATKLWSKIWCILSCFLKCLFMGLWFVCPEATTNYSEDANKVKLNKVNVYKIFEDFFKANLWMIRWSWKILFIYEVISCLFLILIQFLMLTFGTYLLFLNWIFIAWRLTLFAIIALFPFYPKS